MQEGASYLLCSIILFRPIISNLPDNKISETLKFWFIIIKERRVLSNKINILPLNSILFQTQKTETRNNRIEQF